MNDDSFQKDVLNELGDDRLAEIAGLLGTDAAGAQSVVASTADAFAGGLAEKAENATPEEAEEVRAALTEAADPPLQGVAALGGGLGGLLGGGMMAGMLGKMAKPVASAVAKKTGLPEASVTRAIEIALPVVLAVVTKRATEKRNPGAAGAAPGAGGGGLGDLLGQVLGGGKK
ncbi:hypothetical protein GCM10010329_37670 [Streptomyces spiroverticillatus]|uniref:DUF937 domain-containing protein n=1 Tax=Streptomyces finlayi TaxID=67296 RepID=A0A919CAA4_9ACTN|nr:DUF937 domain-containing protein [Streptomyces finlayi]GHA11256.1 hypothetical protein GCM10010329_37670 [Streptomyces spiroverticillatus]GHC95096.1 hypothetical protein GCM10010334_33940 [Streptomyces finlayi]